MIDLSRGAIGLAAARSAESKTLSGRLVLVLAAVLMIGQCIGYVLSYKPGEFPDEASHLAYVADAASTGFPDYDHGKSSVTGKYNYLQHPPLYYMATGAIARVTGIEDIETGKAMRWINVVIAVLTLVVVANTMGALEVSAGAIWVGLSTMLAFPMFVVLASSTSNDPLSFLGVALVLDGVVRLRAETPSTLAPALIVFGMLIASLTKATGALAGTLIVFSLVAAEPYRASRAFHALRRIDVAFVFAGATVVIGYYAFTYAMHGSLLPAPQGNPGDWFLAEHPGAPRWTLFEHLKVFLESNYGTLVKPYGHADFPDIQARVDAVDLLLVLVPLAIIAGFRKASEPDTDDKVGFLAGVSIAFAAFLGIYFLGVRKLHVATGYQGAMQARYAFAFLPVLAALLAIAYDGCRPRPLKFLLLAASSTAFLLGFFPAYFRIADGRVVEQTVSDTNFGELTGGRAFEQTFIAEGESLKEVDLLLATFIRQNRCRIKLEIVGLASDAMSSVRRACGSIVDNDWAEFPFDPIPLAKGARYRLRLTSVDATGGNAITWWAAADPATAARSMFVGTPYGPVDPNPSRYMGGEAIVDGNPTSNDFAFRLHYSR